MTGEICSLNQIGGDQLVGATSTQSNQNRIKPAPQFLSIEKPSLWNEIKQQGEKVGATSYCIMSQCIKASEEEENKKDYIIPSGSIVGKQMDKGINEMDHAMNPVATCWDYAKECIEKHQ